MLIDYCGEISGNPGLDKNYPDIFEDILGLRVGKHIIFYLENETIEIEWI